MVAWLEVGDSEKEEVGYAHRPSFFSYLSPQEFVDVSNQMYIDKMPVLL
ncbi:hypothetical protein [Aneurinibacillus migulanus]|nr:hypothetical protein [Aneurinibacillus migulanus]